MKTLSAPRSIGDFFSSALFKNSPFSHIIEEKVGVRRYGEKPLRSFVRSLGSYFRGWDLGTKDSMVQLNKGNFDKLFRAWLSLVLHWNSVPHAKQGPKLSFKKVLTHLRVIFNSNGVFGLCIYLKASLYFCNSYLLGSPVSGSWHLGVPVSLDKSHLPRWLPISVRNGFRSHDLTIIRVWLSFLNAYKAIRCKKEPSFGSIVSEEPLISKSFLSEYERFVPKFWGLVNRYSSKRGNSVTPPKWDFAFPPILSAGTYGTPSIRYALLDLYSWSLLNPSLIREWFAATGDKDGLSMLDRLEASEYYEETAGILFPKTFATDLLPNGPQSVILESDSPDPGPPMLGRLFVKEEPAGKQRVFAIVDYWTQRSLKPLHDWMFDLLRNFPSDFTFDQERAITYLRNFSGFGASYDLSSATDNIPRTLYMSLFRHVLGSEITNLWLRMLTEREFFFSDSGDYHSAERYTYNRGQPMGCYSSWGALALLHHSLILFAAYKNNVLTWFKYTAYAVCGDDCHIFGSGICQSYLSVCKEFFIPISLKKSFTSQIGGFSFVSRICTAVDDFSPLSLREEISIRTMSQRLEFVSKQIKRGYYTTEKCISFGKLLRLLSTPKSYLKTQGLMTKGRIDGKGFYGLALMLQPFGSVFRSLGFKAASFEPLMVLLRTFSRGRSAGLTKPNFLGELEVFSLLRLIDSFYKEFDKIIGKAELEGVYHSPPPPPSPPEGLLLPGMEMSDDQDMHSLLQLEDSLVDFDFVSPFHPFHLTSEVYSKALLSSQDKSFTTNLLIKEEVTGVLNKLLQQDIQDLDLPSLIVQVDECEKRLSLVFTQRSIEHFGQARRIKESVRELISLTLLFGYTGRSI